MKPAVEKVDAMQELLSIMKKLRDPESGCPWDIKQTWRTILPHTLEEVYEVADAVDRNDAYDLCDELGDLLFQVVFMAQIASDNDLFDFNDVARSIGEKMVRRHPHIFADVAYENETEQKQDWEQIKAQEREAKTQKTGQQPDTATADNFFADIPLALPSLRRAQKIQKRAGRVGFDWDDWRLVVPKVQEELDEVIEAVEQNEPFQRIEEEVGDVLMAASNLARQLNVDAENALRLANNKFCGRFLAVEADLSAKGVALEEADLDLMEASWVQVKRSEKTK